VLQAREHAAQWEQKVADMKETLEELRKIAQQRERKLILSTYSQLDELTGHLARQKEQQVKPARCTALHVHALPRRAYAHRHTGTQAHRHTGTQSA
jgi:hypothetical protein